jgi:hypothetical protein
MGSVGGKNGDETRCGKHIAIALKVSYVLVTFFE